MNEIKGRSFVRMHVGRYRDICFPEGSIGQEECAAICGEAVLGVTREGNRILINKDNYVVIAYQGKQKTDGAPTYYTHGVIFEKTPELFSNYMEQLCCFPFAEPDDLVEIWEDSRRLEDYTRQEPRTNGKLYMSKYSPNWETLTEVVCRCLRKRGYQGGNIGIEVPWGGGIRYQEYCMYALNAIFSCIPYGLREGINFATNPNKSRRNNFTIIFQQSRTGISLESPWKEDYHEESDGLREMVQKVMGKPGEKYSGVPNSEVLYQLRDELEKPNEGQSLEYQDYVDFLDLKELEKEERISPSFFQKLARILNNNKNRKTAVDFFSQKVKALMQEKKAKGLFELLEIAKALEICLPPDSYKSYGELLKRLEDYRELVDELYQLGVFWREELQDRVCIHGIFTKEFAGRLLDRVLKENSNSSYAELLDKLESCKSELYRYFGFGVEEHEKKLRALSMEQKRREKQKEVASNFVDSLREGQNGGEPDQLFNAAVNLKQQAENNTAAEEARSDAAEKLLSAVEDYISIHLKDYSLEEIQSGRIKTPDTVLRQMQGWESWKDQICGAFVIGDEVKGRWDNLMLKKKERETFLGNMNKALWEIENFDSFLGFLENYGWRENVRISARKQIESPKWTGSKEISSYIKSCFTLQEAEGQGHRQYYYDELGILIKQGSIKLHVKRNGSIHTLLEELDVWYKCCINADTICCVCEEGACEDLILSKEEVARCNYLEWDHIGNIEKQGQAKWELVWKRLVPMGYYPMEQWWDEQRRLIDEQPYQTIEGERQNRELLFFWAVNGPGIPWRVREGICTSLTKWGHWDSESLRHQAEKELQDSKWLSDPEKEVLVRSMEEIARQQNRNQSKEYLEAGAYGEDNAGAAASEDGVPASSDTCQNSSDELKQMGIEEEEKYKQYCRAQSIKNITICIESIAILVLVGFFAYMNWKYSSLIDKYSIATIPYTSAEESSLDIPESEEVSKPQEEQVSTETPKTARVLDLLKDSLDGEWLLIFWPDADKYAEGHGNLAAMKDVKREKLADMKKTTKNFSLFRKMKRWKTSRLITMGRLGF